MSSTPQQQCEWCGKPLTEVQIKRRGRFCSTSCSAKWRMTQPEIKARVHSPEVRAKIAEKVGAWMRSDNPTAKRQRERIRLLNPTADPKVREKISKKLQEMGHRPHVRGGNGKRMPVPQRMLLEALGESWTAEYAQSLGPRQQGYPTHYKIDIANPEAKIAIEVDGFSHVAMERRAQDAKKEAKLQQLGWTVLRFSNQEILSSIDTVITRVRSHCTTWS